MTMAIIMSGNPWKLRSNLVLQSLHFLIANYCFSDSDIKIAHSNILKYLRAMHIDTTLLIGLPQSPICSSLKTPVRSHFCPTAEDKPPLLACLSSLVIEMHEYFTCQLPNIRNYRNTQTNICMSSAGMKVLICRWIFVFTNIHRHLML